MYRTLIVFLKCTIQDGPKVDVLLIAILFLWLKFWEGIDKHWIVPVRKLFYFHHCYYYIGRMNYDLSFVCGDYYQSDLLLMGTIIYLHVAPSTNRHTSKSKWP